MQRVLSNQLWQTIRAAAEKSSQRKAAIAYVTRDLIGFRRGDVLVTDASEPAIRMGETDAKLLVDLHRRGVELYCCPCLHAKVLLLDEIAVIGSGNMSESSRSTLVEAALMTDSPSAVSGVASLIEQLIRQSTKLDEKRLRKLTTIEVQRRGRFGNVPKRKTARISELGQRVWMAGTYKFDADLESQVQKIVDVSVAKIAKENKRRESDIGWIEWSGSGRFAQEAKPGDQLVQIWSSSAKARPSFVYKPTAILLTKRIRGKFYVFLTDPSGNKPKIRWGAFQVFMNDLGYRRKFGPTSKCALPADLGEAVSKHWNAA